MNRQLTPPIAAVCITEDLPAAPLTAARAASPEETVSLLRDEGPQLRTRSKKVPSKSKQKGLDDQKKARRKKIAWMQRIRWFRNTTTRAEDAIRLAIAALPLVLLALGFWKATSLPSTWAVSKSVVVQANPPAVFNAIEDLTTWPTWSKIGPFSEGDVQYPVAKSGDSAVVEVHGGGNMKMRLLIDDWEPEVRIGYHLWLGKMGIPRSGVIKLEPEGLYTKVTWKEGGAAPDDPLGMLERFRLEARAEEVSGMVERSLAGLQEAVKGKSAKSRVEEIEAEPPSKEPSTGAAGAQETKPTEAAPAPSQPTKTP